MPFTAPSYKSLRSQIINNLKQEIPELSSIEFYATDTSPDHKNLASGELNWLAGDADARAKFFKVYTGLHFALEERRLGKEDDANNGTFKEYNKLINSTEFKKLNDDEKQKIVDKFAENITSAIKVDWEDNAKATYNWQRDSETNYKAYKETGATGSITEWSKSTFGGKEYVDAAWAGRAEVLKQSPIIKVQLEAELKKIRETGEVTKATDKNKSEWEHYFGTIHDLKVTDKKGEWDRTVKNIEDGYQRFQSGLSAFGNAMQGVGTIKAEQVRSEAGLVTQRDKSALDLVEGVIIDTRKQANQQILNRNTASYQDVKRSRLFEIQCHYQIALAEELKAELQGVEALKHDENLKKDLWAKFKALGIPDMKDATKMNPEKIMEVFVKATQADIFSKYENKIKVADINSVNDLTGEFYLKDDNDKNSNISGKPLKERVLSRKSVIDPASGLEVYEVATQNVDTGAKDKKLVAKSRVVEKVSLNSSGLEKDGSNFFYISDAEAFDINFNSSGNRVDLFMKSFRNKIKNNKNFTEEEKAEKLQSMQTGMEALFGGDKLFKGILGLLLSGQFGLLISTIKEVISSAGGLFGKNKHGNDGNEITPAASEMAEIGKITENVNYQKQAIDIVLDKMVKPGTGIADSKLEITKESADKIAELAKKTGSSVESFIGATFLNTGFGGLTNEQSTLLSKSINEVISSGNTKIISMAMIPANATEKADSELVTNLIGIKSAINSVANNKGLTVGAEKLKTALENSNLAIDEKGALIALFKSEDEVFKALKEMQVKAAAAGKQVDDGKIANLAKIISVDLGITAPASGTNANFGSKKPTEVESNITGDEGKTANILTH